MATKLQVEMLMELHAFCGKWSEILNGYDVTLALVSCIAGVMADGSHLPPGVIEKTYQKVADRLTAVLEEAAKAEHDALAARN